MHIKTKYSVREMAWWTQYETYFFVGYITLWVAGYAFMGLDWLRIPWTPLALIGTAVAFVIGFQNNASYDRIWEARKIWGGIVNASRTFGMFVQDMIDNEHTTENIENERLQKEIKELTYRHIAWMTALRHAMRVSKPWEVSGKHKTNKALGVKPPEFESNLMDDLQDYLNEADFTYLEGKDNKQTALLYLQSHQLKRLKEKGAIWGFSFLQLEGVLKELFALQGKSERIKNFPYPRHFATLNYYFMWTFILLLPMALVPQFALIGSGLVESHPLISPYFIWMTVPFYVVVAWVFHTMERIGATGENPFEGTANDVPISTIARGIEIDLRQNLGEDSESIPRQFPISFDTQF